MFCMQCGAKLPDNAKFCFQCGAKVLLDTSAHESTVLVEPKPVQEANQNDQDSEVKKMPMVPKKELIQPEEKVVLKLGNRNLEFSEEIKDWKEQWRKIQKILSERANCRNGRRDEESLSFLRQFDGAGKQNCLSTIAVKKNL